MGWMDLHTRVGPNSQVPVTVNFDLVTHVVDINGLRVIHFTSGVNLSVIETLEEIWG